jgi:hypothetical protein
LYRVLIPRQITVGVLFGTAAITVILRTIRRVYLFRQFKLDDAFVVFGFLCLSATTGVFFHSLDIIMLQEALAMEPTVIVPITSISRLLNSMTFLDVFLCTIWTCTFAIKGSFLALFRKLIQGVSKNLDRYYWFVVVYTFICWVFMVVEPFVLCPYFGTEGGKSCRSRSGWLFRDNANCVTSKMLPRRQLSKDPWPDNPHLHIGYC